MVLVNTLCISAAGRLQAMLSGTGCTAGVVLEREQSFAVDYATTPEDVPFSRADSSANWW
jgi:hypothetical protein